MICVYPADCTDFSTNGNGTLSPLSANVTETLNGEYELTLVHPVDEAGKWQRLVEGCILRAPVPAAMTPRVNFTAPGDDNRTEVWRVNTDFSGAETRKGTLRLRSGPGTKYKVLATYKNGSFVQVIAKTNSSWYEVTAPPPTWYWIIRKVPRPKRPPPWWNPGSFGISPSAFTAWCRSSTRSRCTPGMCSMTCSTI